MNFLRSASKTIRLMILRVGAGWMFALLTFNFNRVTIADLGAVAVIITSLIGLHHFLSFAQVYWGRLADRHPIFGYRRTPYILLSSLGTSLVFLALPTLAIGLGHKDLGATALTFVLITFFGLIMGMNGSSCNALIAEVTTQKERGTVIAFVWATIIVSGIISSVVAGNMMPNYDPVKMQQLYNLTPIVVMVTAILGTLGLDRRLTAEELKAEVKLQHQEEASPIEAFRITKRLLAGNQHARFFFIFVLLSVLGIFLQDAILEPFGAEVFGMNQKATAAFQQTWGVAALLGMFGIGFISTFVPISKKTIAMIGGFGMAGGLAVISLSGALHQASLVQAGLFLLGLGIGFFDVGVLSMMMEMTVEGQAGLYMGLWGMAQGFGNGIANALSGLLHTVLIETHLVSAQVGYTGIFAFEALVMVVAMAILRGISVQEFKGLSRSDVGHAMAFETN